MLAPCRLQIAFQTTQGVICLHLDLTSSRMNAVEIALNLIDLVGRSVGTISRTRLNLDVFGTIDPVPIASWSESPTEGAWS